MKIEEFIQNINKLTSIAYKPVNYNIENKNIGTINRRNGNQLNRVVDGVASPLIAESSDFKN